MLAEFGLILAVTTGGVQTLNSSSQPMAATLDARAQQSPLDQELTIHEYGSGSAAPIRFYDRDMTKKLHLIIVDDGLQSFMHVHPALQPDGAFILKQHFPHGGIWHLYADGIPHNFGRAVFRFDLVLPGSAPAARATQSSATARAGPYAVHIGTTSLRAGAMTMLTVHIDRGGHAARDLRPYLGARAHAVMIGAGFSYIHAHAMSAHMGMPGMNMPAAIATPSVVASEDPCNQDADVGMSLVELPPAAHVAADMSVMLLPSKPGRYHLWIQFRGEAAVYTAPFIIQVR